MCWSRRSQVAKSWAPGHQHPITHAERSRSKVQETHGLIHECFHNASTKTLMNRFDSNPHFVHPLAASFQQSAIHSRSLHAGEMEMKKIRLVMKMPIVLATIKWYSGCPVLQTGPSLCRRMGKNLYLQNGTSWIRFRMNSWVDGLYKSYIVDAVSLKTHCLERWIWPLVYSSFPEAQETSLQPSSYSRNHQVT